MDPAVAGVALSSLRDMPVAQPGLVSRDGELDHGIAEYVQVLQDAGVETFESCQGGDGHAFFCPTIRFHGEHPEGFRALAVALQSRLPVRDLRRVWSVEDGEPVGPDWELTFFTPG